MASRRSRSPSTRRGIIRDIDRGWERVRAEITQGTKYLAVGIYGAKASADHGGLANVTIAAAHEFGADIDHPGGTAYIPGGEGEPPRFISNEAAGGRDYPRTQPHKITIPARSFLRRTFDARRRQAVALSKNLARKVLEGEMPRERALETLGVFLQGEIRARMAQGIPPPLKAATIKRKGSSKPLIDSGQLRGSIDFEVREKK